MTQGDDNINAKNIPHSADHTPLQESCPTKLGAWAECPSDIRVGTRGSALAIAQANEVKNRLLGAYPGLHQDQIKIVTITTTGDKIQDRALIDIGGKGLFTKEIEEALFSNAIDIAVHSMKDMTDTLPEGLAIDCILEREDPRDAFICNTHQYFTDLPQGAKVGTSSVRRAAQLLAERPDLKILPIRGNVNTRLRKLDEGEVDALVLAAAGIKRLTMQERIASHIDPELMLPAVAQGAIGVEAALENTHMAERLIAINHSESAIAITAERSFLKALGGDCTTPLGALAEIDGETLSMRCLVAHPEGSEIIKTQRKGSLSDAEAMGIDAGEEMAKTAAHLLHFRA